MFVDSLSDAYIFKVIVLFTTGVIAVVVGNWLYEKTKQKK